MAKVLCTLPNASEEISGVKFVAHEKGMLSEDISDEIAADFASIPGYELVGAKAPASEADAERAELAARGEAAGLKVKGNWSIERLRAEVEAAEKAKAEAEAAGK